MSRNGRLPDWLALLDEIADDADAIALGFFRAGGLVVDEKADRSPVTEADRAIEESARSLVERRFPDLGVFGEEYGHTGMSSGARLIIDPIDATRNFVRGIPIFASLLAIEDGGEVVAGLASAPALGMRWHAQRGAGAFCGSRLLRVSMVSAVGEAQLFHGDISGRAEGGVPRGLAVLAKQVERTRGFGDFYQHLLVAEGAGEVAVDPAVHPWDIAPLQVIVEEAGGCATTLTGQRSIYGGSLVSSNGLIHDEALRLLSQQEPESRASFTGAENE
jgi:histidinol-phosphatase